MRTLMLLPPLLILAACGDKDDDPASTHPPEAHRPGRGATARDGRRRPPIRQCDKGCAM